MRRALALACTVAALVAPAAHGKKRAPKKAPEPSPIVEARQLVLVVAPSWDSATASAQRYQRASRGGDWHAVGQRSPVALGKQGLAWGIGLHGAAPRPPVKREGDKKSPAGAFALASGFGYTAPPKTAKLPFVTLTNSIECVDDPSSEHYNAIVDKEKVKPQDWTSSEHMLRPDGLYRVGVVVDHNGGHPVANAGSCTFIHVWSGAGAGTLGCTTLDAARVEELLSWLDPAAHPALVQLPDEEYRKLRKAWKLP
jgi:D-alanyl-D-alanine dipeptidase